MYNFFKKCIPFILVILKLCTSTSGNFTMKDLGIVCGIRDNTILKAIPPQCTAVTVYSDHMEQLGAIIAMKGPLPLLIIVRTIDFSKIVDLLQKDMSEVLADFTNIEFNYMVFDNTYNFLQFVSGSSGNTYSDGLGGFLDKAKKFYPGRAFGLVLGHDVNSMEDRIDLSILNEHSDLYLLESTGYRSCIYHTHQADMNFLATKDDILGSFADLREAGVPFDKLIYTIELKIESIKVATTEDMSYSYLCANKLSDDRKYCFNPIQLLFDKARLRISEGTAGIYINGVELDDVDGSCNCKTQSDGDPLFRGLKTIAGASQEDKNDVSFYDCKEGAYPVIQS